MGHSIMEMSAEEYQLLNEFISELMGLHFPPEKRRVLEARLSPRLAELNLGRYMDYYHRLLFDLEGENEILTHLVTNNETYFFREEGQFETLFEDALEGLRRDAVEAGTLRFLCAGCSSGEEPYTLNIHAREHSQALAGLRTVIDAFDIDQERLETAERAVYGPNSLRSTSEGQIHRYFSRSGADRFSLLPRYREGVRFSRGNILDEVTYPGARPYDVLFCRNVFIYFTETALHRALDNFAGKLRPGGLLFLGHAESIIGVSRRFDTVRLHRCIAYRRTAG